MRIRNYKDHRVTGIRGETIYRNSRSIRNRKTFSSNASSHFDSESTRCIVVITLEPIRDILLDIKQNLNESRRKFRIDCRIEEGGRTTLVAHATRATNAIHIVLDALGQVVVDHLE